MRVIEFKLGILVLFVCIEAICSNALILNDLCIILCEILNYRFNKSLQIPMKDCFLVRKSITAN